MSPKQQNIAIAEAIGWKDVSYGVGSNSNLCLGDEPRWSGGKIKSYLVDQRVPNFLEDLNAMNKAEETLQHYGYYCDQLAWVMRVNHGSISLISATAAQRAEAFLRVLNLYEDDSK